MNQVFFGEEYPGVDIGTSGRFADREAIVRFLLRDWIDEVSCLVASFGVLKKKKIPVHYMNEQYSQPVKLYGTLSLAGKTESELIADCHCVTDMN